MSIPYPDLPARYTCIDYLGDGATGFVFLARDHHLDTDVAVKVVRKNLAMHRRFRARFAREVSMLAQVLHPHIVPVHDFGQLENGSPYVVLAYANRGSLRSILQDTLDLPTFLILMEQVCIALGWLHSQGFIHQDLKPANILLHQEEGEPLKVWVADLGVADDISELARDARRVGGTPGYMAPEQLQGKPQEGGPWTDLYSLGIIFYEALCGQRPHAEAGRKQLLRERLGPPPELKVLEGLKVPEALKDLVKNLLDPEPQQRYDRAVDVARVLRRIRRSVLQGGGELRSLTSKNATETANTQTVAATLLMGATRGGVGMGVRWNRVPPSPLPHAVPPDPGLGASARASLSLFPLRELPLVARESPQQLLWKTAREVVGMRQPRVVIVIGESGSGKSRLVESVACTLDAGGWMEVVRLRYHHTPSPMTGYRGAVRELLAPWNDTRLDLQGRLARRLARDRSKGLTEVLAESGHLARWCGYFLEGENAPDAALGLTFLYQHLEARSWRGGSCLVMENVENAQTEGDGLDIAEALLSRAVGERAVLVLMTLSSQALQEDPLLRKRVEHLQTLGARKLLLPRLTQTETQALVQESLFLEPQLVQEITQQLVGKPLHINILLQDLAARKLLVPNDQHQFKLREGLSLSALPLHDLGALCERRIQSAIASTSDPQRASQVLATIVLGGEDPPAAVIRYISESGLDELLGTGLIQQRSGSLYFAQGALRARAEEVTRKMPDLQRLHNALVQAWSRLGEETGVDVQLALGVHRLGAGDPKAALVPLQNATKTLLTQGLYSSAIQTAALAVRAARAIEPKDNKLPFVAGLESLRLQAAAYVESEDYEPAIQLLQHILTTRSVDRIYQGRLRCLLGRALIMKGESKRGWDELQTGRSHFEALHDVRGRAEVALYIAEYHRMMNDLLPAMEAYKIAMSLSPKESQNNVRALAGLGRVYILQNRPLQARPLLEQHSWITQAMGDTRTIAHSNYMMGILLLTEENFPEAQRVFSTARALAATCGDDRLQLNSLNSLGEVARFQGNLPRATELYTQYLNLARSRGVPEMEAIGSLNLALVSLSQGSMDSAEHWATVAMKALQQRPRHWGWLYLSLIQAVCSATMGSQRDTAHWWELAAERGLEQIHSEDLRLPLESLYHEVKRRGWTELTELTEQQLRRLR